MKCKNPRKIKRYLTQPEEFPTENRAKYGNFTLKELKTQVGTMDNPIPIYAPCIPSKLNNQQKIMTSPIPLQAKIQNKRNALKKLPELVNASHMSNVNEQQNPPLNPLTIKASNPLFTVNALLEILKEDISILEILPRRKAAISDKTEIDRKKYQNEFDCSAKSVKVYRPPRILDNELHRLTHQIALFRRKIYSQQKSRTKFPQPQPQLLTFYNPKSNPIPILPSEINQFL